MRRLVAVLGTLVIALGAATVGAPGAEAQALAMGQCTTSQNVVLAVDFSHWGGPIVRACGSTPTTGFQLLNQGGFGTKGTTHDGPAFICRIRSSEFGPASGYPTPAQEACAQTPPASAYWSYWHANAGANSWSYSQLGAMSYKPTPGSVDLWQFGATNIEGTKGQPGISPNQVRARNTSSSGGSGSGNTRGVSTKAAGGGGRSGGSARSSAAGGAANQAGGPGGDSRQKVAVGSPATPGQSSRPGTAAASTGASKPVGSPSRATGPATSSAGSAAASSGPSIVNADPASATPEPKGSGSATPVLLGLGLAVLLAAGAGFTMVRRRRADPEL